MAKWEGFTSCPGCSYDFSTGDGNRSCSWGECPYLPEELDVYCPKRGLATFGRLGLTRVGPDRNSALWTELTSSFWRSRYTAYYASISICSATNRSVPPSSGQTRDRAKRSIDGLASN